MRHLPRLPWTLCTLPLLLLLFFVPVSFCSAQSPDDAAFKTKITPFFANYCNECHSGPKPKGAFRIEGELKPNFADVLSRGKWREVVNVLNGHEMPPKKAKQPTPKEVAAVVDWITEQTVKAEFAKRESAVVLRRLNRDEYRNTIRDLVGVDVDVSGFPQDPAAGGFDNVGAALTMSPLHVETYLNAARRILDLALVEGDRPAAVKWRFTPTTAAMDRVRVKLDAKNNQVIVNGGNNLKIDDWIVLHHNSWDKTVNARNFAVPTAGTYIVRVKAAGRIPDRAEVVASAEKILGKRRDEQTAKTPKGAKYHNEQYERDLAHFRSDRIYDYGPPRIKLVQQLGPQPRTMAEFDADGTKAKPKIHEFPLYFTKESAGLTFEYAYALPSVLENYWLQGRDNFARPELFIEWFEIEGPIYDAWPPSSHTGILVDSPKNDSDERTYVAAVFKTFMRKAYRRPVRDEEITPKLKHYDAAKKEGAPLVQAIKRPLLSILVSPHFLFLTEPTVAGVKAPRKLNDHELAARLSYFLWSSMPDETLRKLADAGQLSDPAVLAKQVDRMLADPKNTAFVHNFAGQWLGLREVGANPPAQDLYPQYDRHLELSIVKESEQFFREILHGDLDARFLVKSDFVVVNERLARFYGIDGVKGDHFRKVPVKPDVHRGGIPTQASILTITSNGTRTSPVKRGTWILKTLMGIDPGLPLANVGEIAPKVPGIDKATVRKRLEIHRQLDQCARCHNKIDPLGFALENFNAAGAWRDQEGFGYRGRIQKNDPRIDASSEMIDGTKIVGVHGLQDAILKNEDLFLDCINSKMLQFALGRELGLADAPAVKSAVAHMKRNDYRLRAVIHAIVASEAFRTK